MTTNVYFQSGKTIGATNEQRLVEDLIIESMKIYGHDVYYLPRTLIKKDLIFGEDVLSQFTEAYPIEMYLANVDGWNGMQEMFTKFGIEVQDKATFVVSKRRWEDELARQTDNLQIPERPAEGDLLYLPLTDSMFEIKFVEHLDPFMQLAKFNVYTLQCELWQYSSEVVQTGIDEIDVDFEKATTNVFDSEVQNQTGGRILLQNGGSLILAGYVPEKNNKLANNTDFEGIGKGIVDFSVYNPFGEF